MMMMMVRLLAQCFLWAISLERVFTAQLILADAGLQQLLGEVHRLFCNMLEDHWALLKITFYIETR